MKQQLTKEQSRRLIELGVPAEKASSSVVEETQGNGCSWTYPVFTIGDLLEVLPKEIRYGRTHAPLNIGINNLCSNLGYYTGVGYKDLGYQARNELIDALYELCIWCIQCGHIKTYKK